VEYTRQRGDYAIGAVACFLLAVGLAGFAVYKRDWFREIMTGPVTVSPDQLSQATSLESLPSRYVRFEVAEYKETGVRHVTRRRGVHVTEYPLIRVGDRWLPAALDGGSRPRTVVGYLGPLYGHEMASCWDPSALGEIASKLPAQDTQRILSFRLDAKQNYHDLGRMLCYGSVAFSVFFLAISAYFLRKLLTSPPPAQPQLVTASGSAPAAPEWRWR
jgi:hypothetical protein